MSKTGPDRRFLRAGLTGVLAFLLLLGAARGDAKPAVRQVLLLQSFNRGSLPVDSFTGNFRVELDQRAGTPVNVVQVVVGPTGFVGASDQAIVDYIRATFVDGPQPDLIVTVAGPAAVFARKYRHQLFPDTPLILASVDWRFLRDGPPGHNETAIAIDNDFPRLVDTILQLRPQTRQVFMVMGSGALGHFWRQELEEQFRRFRDRLTFVWSNDLSLEDTLQRCASLPDDSAIFYLAFGTDATGGAYADEQVFREIHERATAPLFAPINVMLGNGAVGGRLVAIDDLARNTADVANRLLNGAPPESVNVPPPLPGPPIFDWRELHRWGIAESRLPAGSIVRYRPPSLWEQHKLTMLVGTGAVALQGLLIVGLLYQRRARQRAEMDSRRNRALAADANRRQTMSALTNAIAHELGQPLSSMIHNAQALEMMIAADRATPGTTSEILADIRSQGIKAAQIIDRHRTMLRSHRLNKQPIDLGVVIAESLALVAHDMRTRQIETTVSPSPRACVITGDQVLLQQVIVNLVMNAMDAMAETPPARRRLTISTEVANAEVQVSVRDNGTGLPAGMNGTLFTPFVTTKAQGLGIGLPIAQNIIEAHGGRLDARNNPDGGATFAVTLPRSDAAAPLASAPAAVVGANA